MAEPVTKQLADFELIQFFLELQNRIIAGVNEILTNIAGENTIILVFIISVMLGIIITRWNEAKRPYIFGSVVILLVFMSLRFLGIGR